MCVKTELKLVFADVTKGPDTLPGGPNSEKVSIFVLVDETKNMQILFQFTIFGRRLQTEG